MTTRGQVFRPTGTLTFRSEPKQRRLAGQLMQFDVVAVSQGRRFRFVKGSIELPEPISKLKLNVRHDWDHVVGFAEDVTETRTGLDGVFRVARVPEGDEALQLAEDQVLDGFSIEPQIIEEHRDPRDPTVSVVTHAKLVGVALTAHPAMDDARLTGVFESAGVRAGRQAQRAAWKGTRATTLHKDERGFAVGLPAEKGFYDE